MPDGGGASALTTEQDFADAGFAVGGVHCKKLNTTANECSEYLKIHAIVEETETIICDPDVNLAYCNGIIGNRPAVGEFGITYQECEGPNTVYDAWETETHADCNTMTTEVNSLYEGACTTQMIQGGGDACPNKWTLAKLQSVQPTANGGGGAPTVDAQQLIEAGFGEDTTHYKMSGGAQGNANRAKRVYKVMEHVVITAEHVTNGQAETGHEGETGFHLEYCQEGARDGMGAGWVAGTTGVTDGGATLGACTTVGSSSDRATYYYGGSTAGPVVYDLALAQAKETIANDEAPDAQAADESGDAAPLTAQQEADVTAYMGLRVRDGCPGDAAVEAQAEADVVSDGCIVETYP